MPTKTRAGRQPNGVDKPNGLVNLPELAAMMLLQARTHRRGLGGQKYGQVYRSFPDLEGGVWTIGENDEAVVLIHEAQHFQASEASHQLERLTLEAAPYHRTVGRAELTRNQAQRSLEMLRNEYDEVLKDDKRVDKERTLASLQTRIYQAEQALYAANKDLNPAADALTRLEKRMAKLRLRAEALDKREYVFPHDEPVEFVLSRHADH